MTDIIPTVFTVFRVAEMKMPKTNCLLVSSIDKKLNLCFLLVILGKKIIVRGVGVGKLYGKAPSEWKGGDLTS